MPRPGEAFEVVESNRMASLFGTRPLMACLAVAFYVARVFDSFYFVNTSTFESSLTNLYLFVNLALSAYRIRIGEGFPTEDHEGCYKKCEENECAVQVYRIRPGLWTWAAGSCIGLPIRRRSSCLRRHGTTDVL